MTTPCPGCHKLCALSLEEPEIQSEAIDSGGGITIEVTLDRNSECCGEQMKQATFTLEGDAGDAWRQHLEDAHEAKDEWPDPEMTVDLELTDRRQEKDRHGKSIKNYRYQKQYYGVSATVTITCPACGETIEELTLEDECQASAFEEMV